MKRNLIIRWIAVCFIWLGALFLTSWNADTIAVIIQNAEKEEIYRMDARFWQYNAGKISEILARQETLILPIESLKLGLLKVEKQLTALLDRYKFEEQLIESLPGEAESSGIPVRVNFEGAVDGIAPFLESLGKAYPYLPIRSMKVTTDPFSKIAKFQLQLFFRYRSPTA
jgi:hypothetical protein